MELIHDITGSISTFTAYVLGGFSGILVYMFMHVKKMAAPP